MAKDLGVIVIHGMGSQDDVWTRGPKFASFPKADDLIEELEERISDAKLDPERIAWQPIYWADMVENKELAYFEVARREGDLDYIKLRRFVLTAFGDALAYCPVPSKKNTAYKDVHAVVTANVENLYKVGLDGQERPVIVLAHSLGAHIMSNHIWDLQKQNVPSRGNNVEDMKTVAGMLTFGCNIPLFTFAYDDVEPIQFPGDALSDADKKRARWLNYYDPDDILGYPLKPICDAYREVVDEDIAINVGGWLSGWNPASHIGYWTDNDFTKPVAKYIAEFL